MRISEHRVCSGFSIFEKASTNLTTLPFTTINDQVLIPNIKLTPQRAVCQTTDNLVNPLISIASGLAPGCVLSPLDSPLRMKIIVPSIRLHWKDGRTGPTTPRRC